MSRNVACIALQVRYLDAHIKWSDLVCPDQIIQDGKGVETDGSFFRDSSICDQKVVQNKLVYAVVFKRQKNLSLRITKSIIEKEETTDGSDKFWFPETCIPLYLIREYEEKADKTVERPYNISSELKRSQLKASQKEICSYLVHKR